MPEGRWRFGHLQVGMPMIALAYSNVKIQLRANLLPSLMPHS